MSAAERYKGVCRGGPYDGSTLEWNAQRYPMLCWSSTAVDAQPFWLPEYTKETKTAYEFIDSTWVWRDK